MFPFFLLHLLITFMGLLGPFSLQFRQKWDHKTAKFLQSRHKKQVMLSSLVTRYKSFDGKWSCFLWCCSYILWCCVFTVWKSFKFPIINSQGGTYYTDYFRIRFQLIVQPINVWMASFQSADNLQLMHRWWKRKQGTDKYIHSVYLITVKITNIYSIVIQEHRVYLSNNGYLMVHVLFSTQHIVYYFAF